MSENLPAPTEADIIDSLMRDYSLALQNEGADAKLVAKVVKRLLRARKPVTIKVKGMVDEEKLKRGYRVVTTTFDETLLEHNVQNLSAQAKGVELYDTLTRKGNGHIGTQNVIVIQSNVPEPAPLPEHFRKLRQSQAIEVEPSE